MTSSDTSVGPSTPSHCHSRAPRAVFVAIAVALVAVVTTAVGSAARSDKWWWDNLGGPSSSQFSNLGQITKAKLESRGQGTVQCVVLEFGTSTGVKGMNCFAAQSMGGPCAAMLPRIARLDVRRELGANARCEKSRWNPTSIPTAVA